VKAETHKAAPGPSLVVSVLLTLSFFVLTGCTKPAVLMTKGAPEHREGFKGWYTLGADTQNSVRESLCSGDLEKVFGYSALDPGQQEELRSLICDGGDAVERCSRFFSDLPADVRLDLIRAFEFYDYYVNAYG
jgi:hypothetical protein